MVIINFSCYVSPVLGKELMFLPFVARAMGLGFLPLSPVFPIALFLVSASMWDNI